MEDHIENKSIEENIEEKSDQEDQQENENQPANKCVFVSGIPYDTSEDQIKELFNPCGVIRQIKMPKYQDSGRNIGYAHIYFKKNRSVKKVNFLFFYFLALELNNTYIGTRYINVTMSKGENKNKRKFLK
jgi:nucleolin